MAGWRVRFKLLPPGVRAATLILAAATIIAPAPGHSFDDADNRPSTYLTAGPAVVRITGRSEISLAIPAFGQSGASDALEWRSVLQIPDEDVGSGWRLGQFVCDSARSHLCLVERQRDQETQWSIVDLSAPGRATSWATGPSGVIMDFDADEQQVLLGIDEVTPRARIVLASTDPDTPQLPIWSYATGEDHAYARFINASPDGRSVLLMTGGSGVSWRVIDSSGRVVGSRDAPGRLSTVLSNHLVFSRVSPEQSQAWIGTVGFPTVDEAWPQGSVLYAGGDEGNPPLVDDTREWRLWSGAQPLAFTGSGALWAITRQDDGLSLSEICRSEDQASAIVAQPNEQLTSWLADSSEAMLHGGAPHSGIALISRVTVTGGTEILVIGEPPDPARSRARQTPQICGTSLEAIELSTSAPRLDLEGVGRETFEVTSDDGREIEYTVIRNPNRVGRIMVRPYGAYGLVPQRHLANPLERDWVAMGNTLVVPRLRGDQGTASWSEEGRGDYKRRTTDDLFAVAEDVRARFADHGRLDLLGMSAGGFVAAKAALERPDLFNRIVLVSALLDLETGDHSGQDAEFGLPDGGMAAWFGERRADTDVRPYFIVLHGDQDRITPFAGAASFVEFARGLGYEVRGLSYEGSGHDLARRSDLLADIENLSEQVDGVSP